MAGWQAGRQESDMPASLQQSGTWIKQICHYLKRVNSRSTSRNREHHYLNCCKKNEWQFVVKLSFLFCLSQFPINQDMVRIQVQRQFKKNKMPLTCQV